MSERILIADDNHNIRTMLKMDLETAGYQVMEASNGEQALKLVREHRPDMVVLDVMMPGLDGFEVCSRIKMDQSLRGIPVIMLTAKASKEDRFLGRELGADEYITKPFDPEDLEKVIQRILESRKKGETLHPLTGLPMWQAVKNEIAARKERHENFVVLEGCFDPEAFDIYQKKYGNIKADEIIMTSAELFQSVINLHPDVFLGHRGDNVFFLIGSPGNVENVKMTITPLMAEAVLSFYDEKDRETGYININQPDGRELKIMLMKWMWRLNDVS